MPDRGQVILPHLSEREVAFVPHHEKHPVAVPKVQKLEIAVIAVGHHHRPPLHGYLLGGCVVPFLAVRDEDVMRQEHVVVQQLYGVLELELLPFPERVLSKIFEAGIIDLPEHGGTTMAVLVGHGGLGRSLADAQVVKVPRGGPQSVTDVTDLCAVCKLAENHADKLAPSVKSLAELVGVALAYDALDYFFRESRYCLRKKCYICRHKDKVFFSHRKGRKKSRPLPLSFKKII